MAVQVFNGGQIQHGHLDGAEGHPHGEETKEAAPRYLVSPRTGTIPWH
jgi:hypothetical protein